MFGMPEVRMIGFDYLNAAESDEIQRNLNLLYQTAAGTCPGDRSFGLDMSFEGKPMNVAKNLFALEIIEKTERYESRVEVLDIVYMQEKDGNLTPKITIGRKEQTDREDETE